MLNIRCSSASFASTQIILLTAHNCDNHLVSRRNLRLVFCQLYSPAGTFFPSVFRGLSARAAVREAEVELQIQIAASFHASPCTSRRNRERALRSEPQPNGTDKRINAKIQDTGRARRYISRRRRRSVNLDRESERGKRKTRGWRKLSRSRRLITRRISSESVCVRARALDGRALYSRRSRPEVFQLFPFLLFFSCF